MQAGEYSVDGQPFWCQVLLDGFDTLGGPFQKFLSDNKLSGNMRVIAQKA